MANMSRLSRTMMHETCFVWQKMISSKWWALPLKILSQLWILQVGLVDGVRLHNDLHMRPVAPRLILYLAQRGETVFTPVLLLEVTVAELIASVAELLQVHLHSWILKLLCQLCTINDFCFRCLLAFSTKWSLWVQRRSTSSWRTTFCATSGPTPPSSTPSCTTRAPAPYSSNQCKIETLFELSEKWSQSQCHLFLQKKVVFQVPSASPRCQLIFISEWLRTRRAQLYLYRALNKAQTRRRALNICRLGNLLCSCLLPALSLHFVSLSKLNIHS